MTFPSQSGSKDCRPKVLLFTKASSPLAHADLTLNSTDSNGYQLIYDSVQNITWYNTPVLTFLQYDPALTWAGTLTFGGTTEGSWSLPTTPGTAPGYTNEGQMGVLYYNELGYSANTPITDTGPFVLGRWVYWYSAPSGAWTFNFANGYQDNTVGPVNSIGILAVHPGDVLGDGTILPNRPVPIPGAILLFGPGLLGLAAVRRRFKK